MDNINLIRKIAWEYHKSTRHDWDDLFQEAYIAYHYAMKTYSPEHGQVSTYLWTFISNTLKSYLQKEKLWSDRVCDMQEAMKITRTYTQFWESIPRDIQDAIGVVLEESELLLPKLQKNEHLDKIVSVPMERRLRKILIDKKFNPDCIQRTIHFLKYAI